MKPQRHIVAGFVEHEQLVRALQRLRDAGCTDFEVFTPFPSERVDELLPGKPTPIGWIMLAGGIAGGSGAYFMQWFAAHDYAYNVGGRPIHSWPAFVPATFELTVLAAAVAGVIALLCLARLPRLDHPVFEAPEFLRASQDRFFIALRADDSHFGKAGPAKFLRDCSAESITEVEG